MRLMKDIQNEIDSRGLKLQYVGVSNYRIPCTIMNQNTICVIKFGVSLDESHRGIHMSRLCVILENLTAIDNANINATLKQACKELCSTFSKIEISSCFFLKKCAPATKIESKLAYDIKIEASLNNGVFEVFHTINIPITSLCPCSKSISLYGAHNQRAIIKVKLSGIDTDRYAEIIRSIEKNSASSELFEVLKRPDEKAVTEYAYNNPKFVEDVVRDTALSLKKMFCNSRIQIEATSFESIHAHNAFAYLTVDSAK